MIGPAAEHEIDSMLTKIKKENYLIITRTKRERDRERSSEKEQQQFSIENQRSKQTDSCGKV